MRAVSELRADTPGCEQLIHLNNAGAALMPAPVIRTIREYLAFESEVGGYEAEGLRTAERGLAYEHVARLVGSRARNIAFTSSATASVAQALGSIAFRPGDSILTTRHDYVSSQILFLALEQRFGVRLLRAPDSGEGGVDTAAMARLIEEHRPAVVCLSHVPTNSGLVQDAAAVGAACRAHDVLYLVDGCQTVGQMPVDVNQLQCDFFAATSRKFLRGPRGAGFLHVGDRALARGLTPLTLDMRGATWVDADRFALVDDARRFENFEVSWALLLGTGEAARYAVDLGLEATRDRIRGLASMLRSMLAAVPGVRVLDHGAELCGIVTIAVADRDPRDLARALRAQRINTWPQGRDSALIDYDAKHVSGALRFSPHVFNTEEEIERAVAALRALS